jgi:ornithine cyclodeaminase/alanine dehydrogenase-like protein (mu-crystallin family)
MVGVIGAGSQGREQVLALRELFAIEKVKVWSKTASSAEKYSAEMGKRLGVDVHATANPMEAVTDVDIIVTATPARNAIVMDEWVHPGVHINAIGADGPGKQELDPKIMKRAKIVVDSLKQCRIIGEIQHALSQGIIKDGEIHAEIGEVLTGKKSGRESDDEITLFDSTGIAAQDIAAANLVYQLAKKTGIGKSVTLLESTQD